MSTQPRGDRRPVGSIRWLDDGKARISVSVGRDSSGKRIRLDRTVHGSERVVEKELQRLLIEAGDTRSHRDMTLETYLNDVWLPHTKTRVRRLTYSGYESKVRLHIIPQLGAIRLSQLKPITLSSWVSRMKPGRNALHVYRVLSAALHQAVSWELIAANPLNAVDAPKPGEYEPRVLTAEEAMKVLEAFRGHEIERVVALAIGAGLRRSELVGITRNDIDLDAGSVKVRRGMHYDYSTHKLYEEQPKTKRSKRTIALSKWCVEILKREPWVGPITDKTPDQLSEAYRAHIRKLNKAARSAQEADGRPIGVDELPDIPLRDLRHSHATILLEAGVDVVAVSRRLGHSTVTTTDGFYLRPGRSVDEDAAAKMDEYLAPKCAKSRNARPNAPNQNGRPEEKTG